MRNTKRNCLVLSAALLGAGALGVVQPILAAPDREKQEERRELREARKELKRQKKDVRKAGSRQERREE
jgi:hypothetical protein